MNRDQTAQINVPNMKLRPQSAKTRHFRVAISSGGSTLAAAPLPALR
jgi:hypothetical protein